MRKEILFAILAGGILGLIIAFGVWRVNSSLNKEDLQAQENPSSSPSASSRPDSTSTPRFQITLDKPNPNSVIVTTPVTVSGITRQGSLIAISGETGNYLVSTNQDGAFSEDIILAGGFNNILVTAFDEAGNNAKQNLNVVYSSEFSKYLPSADSQNTSTSSADPVRDKVQQKVDFTLKNPVSLLGSVTDIIDSTLQVKTDSGEIQQIVVDNETSYVKSGKTSKEIKYADIAIGDYLIAMGFKNGNNILLTKRILVSGPPVKNSTQAIFATVNKVSKSGFDATSLSEGKQYSFSLANSITTYTFQDNKVTKSKYSNLEVKDRVIIFTSGDNSTEASSIFMIL